MNMMSDAAVVAQQQAARSAEYSAPNLVIVRNVKGRVVDSVSDVLELRKDDIKPAAEMGSISA